MKEPRQKELEELAEECMVLEEHMHILEAENSILELELENMHIFEAENPILELELELELENMHILEAENSILYHEKEVSSPVLLEEFRSKNMALEARLANANREKVAV